MGGKTIYDCDDYKDFMRTRLRQSEERWGAITRMARAARCQRSYLSRVLHGPVHLTPDHALGLCELWKLPPGEEDYFLTLVDRDRAGSVALRKHLELKLTQMRKGHDDLGRRVNRKKTISEQSSRQVQDYYSSWQWSAVHIIVSIPRYRTPAAIATRLQLPESIVQTTLEGLALLGLVRRERDSWVFNSSEIHVPRESPLVSMHRANWRSRALLDAQAPGSGGLHFTVVQAIASSDFERLKRVFLDAIGEYSVAAAASGCEDIVAVNCDFFRVP